MDTVESGIRLLSLDLTPEGTDRTARVFARALERYVGKTLVGVVDGVGAIEFVFSPTPSNLLTITPRGLAHGFVHDPEEYVAQVGVSDRKHR